MWISLSSLEPCSTDSQGHQHRAKKLSHKIALHFKLLCESKVTLPLIFLNHTSRQSSNMLLCIPNFEPLSFFAKSKYICLRYCHVIYLSLGCSSECILVCNSSFQFQTWMGMNSSGIGKKDLIPYFKWCNYSTNCI